MYRRDGQDEERKYSKNKYSNSEEAHSAEDSMDSNSLGNSASSPMSSSNASLKLKIRLPGKMNSLNSSGENLSFQVGGKTTPNMNASSNLNNSSNSNSSTPKSIEHSDSFQDVGEVPIRVKIKKADFLTSITDTTNTKSNNLNFYKFPNYIQEHALFQKSLSSNSANPDGFLHKWNEKDIALLKDELELIRHSVRKFSTSLQGQITSLENLKKNIDKTPSTSTPISASNSNSLNSSSSQVNLNSSTKNSKKIKGSGNYKKQKTGGEFGSDNDSNSVYQYDEDSPMEDEINIGDVEDQFGHGSNELGKSGKLKNKTEKKNLKKNKMSKNKSNLPPPPSNPLPPTGKKQGKLKRQGSTRIKDKKKANPQEELSYLDDHDDDDAGIGKYGKSTFWSDIDPYFAPFTDADLKFCLPVNVDADECVVAIPPLGKHYKEVWADEDNEEFDKNRYDNPSSVYSNSSSQLSSSNSSQSNSQSQSHNAENQNGTNDSEKMISCGDLTSRILSALIEESIVPSSYLNGIVGSSGGVENSMNFPKDQINSNNLSNEEYKFLTNFSPYREHQQHENMNNSITTNTNFPLETPPTFDYSQAVMYSLEERIKMELRSIGLLDEDDMNNQREDDEVCSEIRKLQKQLKDRVTKNNIIKAKLHPVISNLIVKEENERKERANNSNMEKQYLKLMRKKKTARKSSTKTDIT